MAWDVSSWFKELAASTNPSIVRKLHVAYLKDRTDNQYDAVGQGSPIFVNGTVAKQGVRFDGADDRFGIIGMFYQASSLGHGLTVEARAAVSSLDANNIGGDGTYFASFDRNEYWRVGIGSAVNSVFKPSFNIQANSVTNDLSGSTDVADGQFHMLSYRFDPSTNGGQAAIFVDGVLDTTIDSLGTYWGSNSGSIRYGLLGENSEAAVFNESTNLPRLRGTLEELRIWHVARTDSEINSYHDTTSLDTTSGLQLHYDMESMGNISDRVTQWPTLRRHWSDIRPQAASVSLANNDGEFDVFFNRTQAGLSTFAVEFGFESQDNNVLKIDSQVGSGALAEYSQTFSVSSGDTVKAWCQAKPFGAPSQAGLIRIRFGDASSNTLVRHVTVASADPSSMDWQLIEGSTTVNSGEAIGALTVWVNSDDQGGWYFDNAWATRNDTLVNSNGDFETGDKTGWAGGVSDGEVVTQAIEETIIPFAGRLGNVFHSQGRMEIAIDDKVSQLSDRVVGDIESPVTYTDSSLASDIAWDVVTTYGGLSSVQSTSNPDIDYSSFSEWAGVFSGDSIQTNAEFTGQKVTEALRKIARYTQSAIYMEGGKLRFSRFTAVNTETTFIDGDDTITSEVRVDMLELITKQIVLAGYNTNTEEWTIQTSNIDSDSSVSYGIREAIEKDQNIWYTDSVSALNLAQRFTLIGGNPYEQIQATTTLAPLARQVGETINYSNPQINISKGYRIMESEFNIDDGTFLLGINASQTETPFVLDQSALDGSDKLL